MDPQNELVPDIGSVPAIRKARVQKHDFKDGAGKVAAHRHDNGHGWVADTAYAAPSVVVKRGAGVAGFARVYDSCIIGAKALVAGHAKVYGNVTMLGNTSVRDSAIVCGQVTLSGNAAVSGVARVFGSCALQGDVRLSDDSQLVDTSCHNDTARPLVIFGGSRIHSSRLYNGCYIRNSRVSASSISVCAVDESVIDDATVSAWLNGSEFELAHSVSSTALEFAMPLLRDVKIINGFYNLPAGEIANVRFISCEIRLPINDGSLPGRNPDLQRAFMPIEPTFYVNNPARLPSDLFPLTANQLHDVRQNRPAVAATTINTSQSPILTAVTGSRRILRLGEPT